MGKRPLTTTDVTDERSAAGRRQPHRVISRPMLTFFILGDVLGTGLYTLTGKVGGAT